MSINFQELDVFYSDLILGVVLLIAAHYLYSKRTQGSLAFLLLGLSTIVGGFYHALYNNTLKLPGELLWTSTMVLYVGSSLLFLKVALPRLSNNAVLVLSVVYLLFNIFISESFIFGILIQLGALIVLSVYLIRTSVRPKRRTIVMLLCFWILSISAISIQQAHIQFINDWSHNTWFHILEIPAVILLALTIRHVLQNSD